MPAITSAVDTAIECPWLLLICTAVPRSVQLFPSDMLLLLLLLLVLVGAGPHAESVRAPATSKPTSASRRRNSLRVMFIMAVLFNKYATVQHRVGDGLLRVEFDRGRWHRRGGVRIVMRRGRRCAEAGLGDARLQDLEAFAAA